MGFETSRGPNAALWNEQGMAPARVMPLDAGDSKQRESLWLPLALGTAIASAVIISAAVWVAEPLPVEAAAARPADALAPVATTTSRAPGG